VYLIDRQTDVPGFWSLLAARSGIERRKFAQFSAEVHLIARRTDVPGFCSLLAARSGIERRKFAQ
jgi:hypothetical protein